VRNTSYKPEIKPFILVSSLPEIILPMKTFETLTDALEDLKKRGYSNDFNLQPDAIECGALDLKLRPEDFHVDEIYRFEGMNDRGQLIGRGEGGNRGCLWCLHRFVNRKYAASAED
jgi:hypothetical protein